MNILQQLYALSMDIEFSAHSSKQAIVISCAYAYVSPFYQFIILLNK